MLALRDLKQKARGLRPRAFVEDSLQKHSPLLSTQGYPYTTTMELEYTSDGKGARSFKLKLSLATFLGFFSGLIS
jgi:hypothetical protein